MRSDLSIVFVVFVGILAVFVLRDDIRHRKIRNRLIVNGLLGGVALFSVGLLTGTVEWWYFREVLMNASISFLVAFVFWQFSLWPAGDAKLFALFSLLLPLHYYWRSYLPFFPSLALLVNIFVVAYAVLILRASAHFIVILFRREVLFPDFIPTAKALLTVDGLLSYLRTRSVPAVLIGGGKVVGMFFAIRYVFFRGQSIGPDAVWAFASGMLLWGSIFLIIRKFIADNESYIVETVSIRSGMSPLISAKDADIFPKEFLRKLGPIKADGLDSEQATLLRESLSEKGVGSIAIQKNIPFSPWIVLGLLITLVLRDNLFKVALTLLRW